MKYCSQCGGCNTYDFIEGNKRFHCLECNIIHYQNPKPTATLICFNQHKILLGKRAFSPAKNKWGLIGGFMELNETLEQAALRELYEETQLTGKVVDIIGTASHFNTIFGDILLIGLKIEINNWKPLKPGDDISEAKLFDINNLPKLAFESHQKLIDLYIKKHSI